jgi:hypothetical protein
VGKLIQETITLEFQFSFLSSVNEAIITNSSDSIKLVSGSWAGKGFLVGETVGLFCVLQDANGYSLTIAGNFVIQSINGSVMTFTTDYLTNASYVGLLCPLQGGSSFFLVASSRTQPESIEIFHNLQENSASQSNNSILDGAVNRFVIEAVDTMAIGGVLTAIQEGNKSGGTYFDAELERLADGANNETRYEFSVKYFIPNIEDANFDEPTFYENNQCLKPTYRINGYPQTNNPNSSISVTFDQALGNTGWYNEAYNQGDNDFNIDSVSIENLAGDTLNVLDHNQTCKVTAVISGDANFNDAVEVSLSTIPPTNEYENNEFSHGQNTYLTHFFKDGGSVAQRLSFNKLGRELITQNEIVTIGTNQITVSFEIVPNAAFTTYIESLPTNERRYRLGLTVESVGGTENDNNSVTLILQQNEFEAAPIPDQPFSGVTFQGFFNHSQDLSTGVSELIYNGTTEDDFVYLSKFNLSTNDIWEQLRASIEVVRDSDGATFKLDEKIINLSNFVVSNGVQNIDFEQDLNQYLDAVGRNIFRVQNTGNQSGGSYEVQLTWSLLANWRNWLSNPDAFTDFFDSSLPSDGRSREWMRYLRLNGYSIRLRVRLIKEGVAYFWGSKIEIQDYEDNLISPNITTTITYEDQSGQPVNVLLANQQMTVIATHVLNSGSWAQSDVWGWISRRGFESDPNKRISTVHDWTNQNLPLKPLAGDTTADLTFPSANIAVVKCLLDTSLINIQNTDIIARIESPIAPPCQHPIDFTFDYMESVAANESEYVQVLEQLLINRANGTDANICEPECEIVYSSPSMNFTAWAFGSQSDVEALVDVKGYCCQSAYIIGGEPECDVNFDANIAAINAIVDGDTTVTDGLVPTVLNSYSGVTDAVLLKNRLESITSDEVVRYNIYFYIVSNGITLKRDISSGQKYLTNL